MKWFTIVALAIAIGLATAAGPLASSSPDGLERVAADKGFAARAHEPDRPVLDYDAALGGAGGALLAFGIGLGVAKAVRR